MVGVRRCYDRHIRNFSARQGDHWISHWAPGISAHVFVIRLGSGQDRLSTSDISGLARANTGSQECSPICSCDALEACGHATYKFWTILTTSDQQAKEALVVTEAEAYVLAIDAGTTGVRCRAVFQDDRPSIASYQEFTQYFPEPGWVEHDAEEIWRAVVATFNDVVKQAGLPRAIGITNQRETVVSWNRRTGEVYGRAIVWQDRRTAQHCQDLDQAGHLATVRALTGLVLDPYFSGTKMSWMLQHGVPRSPDLALATIDTWLLWKLTDGAVFATDPSNASRTMLFDITTLMWSPTMSEILGVPLEYLAEVRPSSGRFGITATSELPLGIAISGIAGDQQAALFGQRCIRPGMAKNTYGTGCFVLLNTGEKAAHSTGGLLTTLAAQAGNRQYALEGSVFMGGAAIQWLRDGLKLIRKASDVEALASTVQETGGVFLVPAFTGLGAPYWDPEARGAILGMTRATSAAHIARAALESIALQSTELLQIMQRESGIRLRELRVDGGAAANNLLMQMQADLLGVPVVRPRNLETTALGAAYLAGLAAGVWKTQRDIASPRHANTHFEPRMNRAEADERLGQWRRAVQRVLHQRD